MATARALALPEVLENIFSHLDFYDLVAGVQRVCKDFYQMVNSAPILLWKTYRLSKVLPGRIHEPKIEIHEPFFTLVTWIMTEPVSAIRFHDYREHIPPAERDKDDGYMYKNAGCKSHFVTRPPLQTMTIKIIPDYIEPATVDELSSCEVVIHCKTGVTVDDFLNGIYRYIVENMKILVDECEWMYDEQVLQDIEMVEGDLEASHGVFELVLIPFKDVERPSCGCIYTCTGHMYVDRTIGLG